MHRALSVTIAIVLALAAAAPAAAQSALFPGTWQNADARTRGIVRMVVEAGPAGQLVVQAFGACAPTPCDWGRTEGVLYGSRVDGDLQQTAQAAIATYTTDHSVTILVIRPLRAPNNPRLTVQAYTRFTDTSGRAAYTQSAVFAAGK